MISVTLQGGPADGDMVLVREDTIRHGTYYYTKRLTVDEIASTYRYKRKGQKTHRYVVERRLDGYVGVYTS